MINIRDERMLSVKEATEWLAERNIKVTGTTLRSWIAYGNQGIKLESIKLGGILLTSEEAIERFVQRLNGGDEKVVTTRRREKEKAEAYRKACELFGVCQIGVTFSR